MIIAPAVLACCLLAIPLPVAAEPVPEPEPAVVEMGEFTVTAYCACHKCCGKSDGITASGTKAAAGRTIAVDPRVIPLGTVVEIDGLQYVAEDTGGAIKGNKIDVYHASHAEAIAHGVQRKTVRRVVDSEK